MQTTREAVPRALVFLEWSGPPVSQAVERTDNAGKFSFRNLPPGRYRLRAFKRNIGSGMFGATRSGQFGQYLTLAAGETRAGVVVPLLQSAKISGTILLDGEPAQMQVILFRRDFPRGRPQPQMSNSTQSNSRGVYRFTQVPPGRYWVMATQRFSPVPDSVADDEFYGGGSDWTHATPLVVRPQQALEGIDIALTSMRGASISGTVSGLPPASPESRAESRQMVSVQVRSARPFDQNFGQRSVLNMASNRFESHHLTPGTYRVMAQTIMPGPKLIAQQTVDVREDVQDLNLELRPAPSLKGQVRMEGAAAGKLERMQVRLTSPEGNPPVVAAVQADGTFLFPEMLPGIWDIEVRPLPTNSYYKAMLLDKQDVLTEDMVITPGNTATLTIQLGAAAGQVQGKVEMEERDPKIRMVLLVPEPRLRHVIALYSQTTLDSKGNFTLKHITPGRYKLFAVEQLSGGALFDPDIWASLDEYGKPVEVKAGETVNVNPQVIPAEALP